MFHLKLKDIHINLVLQFSPSLFRNWWALAQNSRRKYFVSSLSLNIRQHLWRISTTFLFCSLACFFSSQCRVVHDSIFTSSIQKHFLYSHFKQLGWPQSRSDIVLQGKSWPFFSSQGGRLFSTTVDSYLPKMETKCHGKRRGSWDREEGYMSFFRRCVLPELHNSESPKFRMFVIPKARLTYSKGPFLEL